MLQETGMGLSNIDKENGIRYGVISAHSLNPDVIYDVMSEGADYGKPTCGMCGNAAIPNDVDCEQCEEMSNEMTRGDYHCHECGEEDPTKFDGATINIRCFYSDSAFPDEPNGWAYDADGYKLADCLSNDVFVIQSPFYTYARFCSPCVPGAGNLDSPLDLAHGNIDITMLPKIYCLGHDWFDDGKAPYKVFRVSDNSEVFE